MTTPAHEWREVLVKKWQAKYEIHPSDLRDIIEDTLTTHTAHLVERIESMAIVDDYGEERKIGFQIAKDQAIDIVKGKTPEELSK